MKKIGFNILFVLLFFCFNCSDAEQVEALESEEDPVEISLTPPDGIPDPFNLFTVIDDDVPRSEFDEVSKWYQEEPGKQVFQLFTGDEFIGERKHARTEAGQGLKFKEGTTWHTLEATMHPSDKLDITYTIAQLFAGCCGPQLRVEVRTNGRIHVGSRSNENVRISTDEDWANGQRSFTIKIRTNGRDMEVYFNNELKFTGVSEESTMDNVDALYHFRWGVYSNEKMKKNLSNTVTNITRN
ncbi:polysaccharide lyase family 7 protein [Spongiivirga citrea]|uniref:Alginate lyase 2 domain-containing protein n=1 Tax=Spongiivirga citrea TaxID=1481457 RepID=A0A6M0CQM0_9FLAO|nr:polysaccharide lyase family 7 protein [Spongiivirga citrea]NER17807.1 hypothetical protein [Spongiivirga citrea]